MSDEKVEKELLEVLLSYQNCTTDLDNFIDIIILFNKKGVSKKKLIDILFIIVRKLDESQIVQETIVCDVLDYVTGWARPLENRKEYSLLGLE